MLKFVIFFCALFVSEAIGVALNSCKCENVSATIDSTTPSENNSSLVSNNASVDLTFRTQLVKNVNATFWRFEAEYWKLYAVTPEDDIDAQTNYVASNLYYGMKDIFKRENDSVAEYYKEKVATKCVSFVNRINELINIYNELAYDPISIDQKNATYAWEEGIAIYDDTKKELKHLNSSAPTCQNDECIEIQKRLNDLNIDEKLKKIGVVFPIYTDSIYLAMDEIRYSLNPYRERYENDAKKSFTNFKKCVELEKRREEFNKTKTPVLETKDESE